jgi:hypothetical protein
MFEGIQVGGLLQSNDLVAGRHTTSGCCLLAWLVHDGQVSVDSSSMRNGLALGPSLGAKWLARVAPKF